MAAIEHDGGTKMASNGGVSSRVLCSLLDRIGMPRSYCLEVYSFKKDESKFCKVLLLIYICNKFVLLIDRLLLHLALKNSVRPATQQDSRI